MQPSHVKSFTIPNVGTLAAPSNFAGTVGAPTPSLLVQAADLPLRVVVRNVSLGLTVWLAYDGTALQVNPVTDAVYDLPAGASDTFVLAPKQKFFAIASGDGARVSIAVSEALPLDLPGK